MKTLMLNTVIPLLAALAVTHGAPGNPDEGATRRLALVIGSHEGGKGRDRLVYAGSDAAAFRRTLEELGGLNRGDATILVDPDSLRVVKALDDMEERVRALKRTGARVEALVYYSGHANEKGILLGSQAIDYRVFRARMNSLGADVRIAVLDACESGALTRLKGGHTAPAFLVDRSTRSEGYAILTSSSESESSQESDRVGGSFFTNALNTGLRGAADASRDGKVTLHEAYQFAYNETLARTETSRGGPQHAGYDIQLNGSGDVVLTDLRQGSSFMDLSEDLSGRLFIRDSTGHLVAELQKPSGRDMRIGLSAGAYEVRLLRGDRWASAVLILGQEQTLAVGPKAFRGLQVETMALRGDTLVPGPVDSVTGFHYVDESMPSGFSASLIYDVRRKDWAGVQLAFFATDARQNRRGSQTALGFNVTRGDLEGWQGAVFVNAVGGSLHGFQLAQANIVSDNLEGMQLSPLLSVAGGHVGGLQLSGLMDVAGGGLKGWQVAGIFTVSGEDTRGGQTAGIFNVTAGGLKGLQAAGIFNVAGRKAEGLQLAGILNVAGDGVKGGQGAGIFNIVHGDIQGGHGAGIFNAAWGDVKGGQGAGIFNATWGEVKGVQGAGILNAAKELKGVQVAAILNVGGKVNGYQVGLINLADEYESGAGIGLINVSRKGSFEGESWVEETGLLFTGLRTSAGWMHSHFAVGWKPRGDQRMFAPTLGFSGQYAFGGTPLFMEGGAFYSTLFKLEKYAFDDGDPELHADWSRVRAGLGIKPLSFLSIVGGLSYNCSYHPYTDLPITGSEYAYFKTYGNTVSLWPGAYAGIRIGK
jgi:hypothetical protein